jgi:peptide-methionine (S)-S-oxide reductase
MTAMSRRTLIIAAVAVVPLVASVVYLFAGSSSDDSGVSSTPHANFPVLDASERTPAAALPAKATTPDGTELATFGSGCFWCTEAVFQQLKGVKQVVSGYSGGHVPNPTYKQVCEGSTGHAEVIQLTFDPKVVSYPELLEVFWRTHDPTTPNRQGNDRGTQYRSVIFYHSEEQKALAERYREKIDAAGVFNAPVVTVIEPYQAFFPATQDHQNFYSSHPQQGYCRAVIAPKLEKLRAVFGDRLKEQ